MSSYITKTLELAAQVAQEEATIRASRGICQVDQQSEVLVLAGAQEEEAVQEAAHHLVAQIFMTSTVSLSSPNRTRLKS